MPDLSDLVSGRPNGNADETTLSSFEQGVDPAAAAVTATALAAMSITIHQLADEVIGISLALLGGNGHF